MQTLACFCSGLTNENSDVGSKAFSNEIQREPPNENDHENYVGLMALVVLLNMPK